MTFSLISEFSKYFPEVFFNEFNPEENGFDKSEEVFTDLEESCSGGKLDLQQLLKKESFQSLLSEKVNSVNTDIISIEDYVNNEGKGVIQYYLEDEDKNFIRGFNKVISKVQFDEDVSPFVPDKFYNNLQELECSRGYNSRKKRFEWDFSQVILGENYKPKEPFIAFKRFAHGEYTCMAIGTVDPKAPQGTCNKQSELFKLGQNLLYEKLVAIKTWDLVVEALQECAEKNLHTPRNFEAVEKSYFSLKKKSVIKDLDGNIFEKKLDKNDMQNLGNAKKDIIGKIPTLEYEKLELVLRSLPEYIRKTIEYDTGDLRVNIRDELEKMQNTEDLVETLSGILTSGAVDFTTQRRNTLEYIIAKWAGENYTNILSGGENSGNEGEECTGDGGENSSNELFPEGDNSEKKESSQAKESKILPIDDSSFYNNEENVWVEDGSDNLINEPSYEGENLEQKVLLSKLFEYLGKQFKGDEVFINKLKEDCASEHQWFVQELGNYLGKTTQNDNSYLFQLYCNTFGYNSEDQEIKKFHRQFAERIRKAWKKFKQNEVKDEEFRQ